MGAGGPYVLVGGWPGSGKTTLARALAPRLRLGYLGKDDVKEQLMAAFGEPADVAASRRLGETAARLVLHLPGAVVDSTWFPYAAQLVAALPGPVVEVRCVVPLALACERYRSRRRAAGHRDRERTDEELRGTPVAPLGAGPLVEVDTSRPVDLDALTSQVVAAADLRA